MGKMTNCKACGKEIANGAKKCPHCGKDQRNFFMKHKIITILLAVILIGAISSAMGKDKDGKTPSTNTTDEAKVTQAIKEEGKEEGKEEVKEEAKPTAKSTVEPTTAPEITKYSDGKYLVGKDIQSGLYKVTLTDSILKMGYVERAKDINMEFDSIIANIVLTGNGYVEILDSDVAVKLQGVEIEPIDIKSLKPDIKEEATDGIYLIGYDLSAGTYKVEVTDTITGMGYVERSKSVAMGMDDIIANEIIQGPSYVKIEEGDFAVRLQGVKIKLQK